MGERKLDRSLYIRTSGIREWNDGTVHYNRYEATPYTALEKLFQTYKLNEGDELVDFGCGRGRVAFYIHNRFQVPVTGVEANCDTYGEAIKNKRGYMMKTKHIKAPIRFEYGTAESYEIKEEENRFYFFNPFSIKVFRQVVNNILDSLEKQPRSIDLIIYYPTSQYKQFLQKDTPFELTNRVKISGVKDKREKFLIYRFFDRDEDYA
ncbi:MAG TPA: SAM-dependent methyltransferase [Clostridia bacterium]|nr:SAM-dependent methyltransferase [Clostridia bacterium]